MGTRGFVGFVVDGTEKITYNHFDSYPEGLGVSVLEQLRARDLDNLKARAAEIKVIEETEDAYARLRDCQGGIDGYLAKGEMIDNSDFPQDSLFCEYGYLVDIDAGKLEVYRGFQQAPHTDGRFALRWPEGSRGYWPVALVASYDLAALPSDETFIRDADAGLSK